MRRTPFLIVGDAPGQPTGLSRILGDLYTRLVTAEDLDLDVRVCGYQPWAGLPAVGVRRVNDGGTQYWNKGGSDWVFSDLRDWGTRAVQTAYRSFFGNTPGIVFTCWDPGRCLGFSQLDLPVQKWGYFAVDAQGINGSIGGPAAQAVAGYDRVLAYSAFGQHVLSHAAKGAVEWLPHGLDLSVWKPEMTTDIRARVIETLSAAEGEMVLGCVATNTARKDLGLFAQTLAHLRHGMEMPIRGWLHTNQDVSDAWSVPQLAADCGIEDALTVTTEMSDPLLAGCYASCIATLAPGRGEGFGYPIAESMACGTPVAHVAYAGGAPYAFTLLDPVCYHATGPYALRRPILDPVATALALKVTIQTRVADPAMTSDRCRRVVEHLDWPILWPLWLQWVKEGL